MTEWKRPHADREVLVAFSTNNQLVVDRSPGACRPPGPRCQVPVVPSNPAHLVHRVQPTPPSQRGSGVSPLAVLVLNPPQTVRVPQSVSSLPSPRRPTIPAMRSVRSFAAKPSPPCLAPAFGRPPGPCCNRAAESGMCLWKPPQTAAGATPRHFHSQLADRQVRRAPMPPYPNSTPGAKSCKFPQSTPRTTALRFRSPSCESCSSCPFGLAPGTAWCKKVQ